jgi:hypothetical protein
MALLILRDGLLLYIGFFRIMSIVHVTAVHITIHVLLFICTSIVA